MWNKGKVIKQLQSSDFAKGKKKDTGGDLFTLNPNETYIYRSCKMV